MVAARMHYRVQLPGTITVQGPPADASEIHWSLWATTIPPIKAPRSGLITGRIEPAHSHRTPLMASFGLKTPYVMLYLTQSKKLPSNISSSLRVKFILQSQFSFSLIWTPPYFLLDECFPISSISNPSLALQHQVLQRGYRVYMS